jgi:hypothetical protein
MEGKQVRAELGIFQEPVKGGGRFGKFDFWRSVEKAAEHRRSPKRYARFNDRCYLFPQQHC